MTAKRSRQDELLDELVKGRSPEEILGEAGQVPERVGQCERLKDLGNVSMGYRNPERMICLLKRKFDGNSPMSGAARGPRST